MSVPLWEMLGEGSVEGACQHASPRAAATGQLPGSLTKAAAQTLKPWQELKVRNLPVTKPFLPLA